MSAVPYSQEIMFLTAFFGGALLGLMWDVYRLIRHFFKIGRLGLIVGDVMYWIASLYFGLNIIVYISWGNIRLFILLGFILGGLVYSWLLSDIILGFLINLINFVIILIKKLYIIIISPLKILIKRLKNFLIPYKISITTKIRNKRKFLKVKYNELKLSRKAKKERKKKLKRIKRLIEEQKRNEKKIKDHKVPSRKYRKRKKSKCKKEKKEN